MSIAAKKKQGGLQPISVDVSEAVRKATARLNRVPGIRKKLGVIRLWPELQVAEHENIARLRRAAELIGAEVIDLDRHGGIIKQGSRPVSQNDVDFVLHLHFETPKCYEPLSIAALWNPYQFYFDWGFERFWNNQMSHDLFAWTGSQQMRALVVAARSEAAAFAMPLLNHTLAEPILVPTEKPRYEAFYCGINWDKIVNKKGRHDEFLKALDKSGRLQVYGPEALNGVRVWDGFKGYRGQLPFDGKTVIHKVWQAGASLVFSSDAHKASGIMSSRLFEAMAGGAVVLGDDHPFIREAIGDFFVQVPMDLTYEARSAFVVDVLEDFDRNPGSAVAIAVSAQRRLVDSYFLCEQIAQLFEAAEHAKQRRRTISRTAHAGLIIDIVVQALDRPIQDITRFLEHLNLELGEAANIVLLVSEGRINDFREFTQAQIVGVSYSDSKRLLSVASMLNATRPRLKARKILFMLGFERFLGAVALSAIVEFGASAVGRLSYVIRHTDKKGEEHYDYFLGSLSTEFSYDPAIATYVFERAWLEENCVLPELSTKGLARLAARNGHDIPICYPSALQVDLGDYEALLSRGYRSHDWRGSEAGVVDRFVARQQTDSSDVGTLSVARLQPLTTGDNIPGEVSAALRLLPVAERLTLARNLFEVLPIPSWMRRLVRVARRRLGS